MNMDNLLKQYEISVPFEFTENAVADIAEVLKIHIDYKKLKKAFTTRDPCSEDVICIFCDENDNRNFIMIDCNHHTFHGIIVRCYGSICEKVKHKMLEVDTELRKMLSEETNDDLENTISDPKSGINFMIKIYKNFEVLHR